VPRNDPALVDSVARRFGFLPADQIRLQVAEGRRAQLPVGDAVSVGRLLTEFVELQQIATRKQIQIMSEHTRCPVTKPKLLGLCRRRRGFHGALSLGRAGKRKSVFDLLEEYPACELPFHAYLEMLSLLAPRYYSISSSPSAIRSAAASPSAWSGARKLGPRHLQGRVLELPLRPPRRATPSMPPVRETKAGFRLPDDPSCPIIMIGPHGLAPFRGFLQERAARKAKGAKLGPAVLFFGCRHPDRISSMPDELKALPPTAVSELHTAFSRADGPKTYVQHQVMAQKERVWNLIEQGAIVYVCGDGGQMEPDVKAALVAIYREKSGADTEAGLRWIDDLGTKNRYVLDVWGRGIDWPRCRPPRKRGTQYAAAAVRRQAIIKVSGILDRPVKPDDDSVWC
jgi:cytochrome P450/NADPH-cytochrome P450 reductase